VPYPMLIDIPETGQNYDQLIFQSIEWSSEVRNKNGDYLMEETLDKITVRTPTLTTGPISLVKGISLQNTYNKTMRSAETVWHFNKLRNRSQRGVPFLKNFYNDYDIDVTALAAAQMWFNTARFIDKYAVVRFEYSNLYDRQFLLLDHLIYNRQSFR